MSSLPKIFGTLGILLGLGCFLFTPAWASPTITKVSVHNEKEIVSLEAELTGAFSDKILEAIESGVSMTFTYEVELRKKGSVFGDEVVSNNTITQTVQYDSLKKVYQFTSQGTNVSRKITTKSTEHYQQLMLTLKEIPVIHVYKLDPDEEYYVRVKAKMEADGLWFPFNYLLFFVPFNEFETSWAQSTPLTVDMDEAFGVEVSQKKSQSAVPAQGVANGIRSFNQ